MSVRIVLLGPPGSGKGTLAQTLSGHFTLPHLSTGDMFRREIARRSALGRTVQAYVESGRLVPDELVVRVMTKQLTPRMLQRGFVLDGFPRTVGQADGLNRYLTAKRRPLDGAVYLACSSQVLIRRLSGRRVCKACGAIYHVRNMRPKRAGICDRCGGALITRKDDAVSTIATRLAVDRAKVKPLLAYYRTRRLLFRIDSNETNEKTFRRIQQLFGRQSWACPAPRGGGKRDRAQDA